MPAVNLANTILGAGMLGLPGAFAKWGILMGCIGLVVAGSAAGFALHLLSECADYVGRPAGFYQVAERAQPRLGIVIDFAVAIKCFGVASSYLTVVADSMTLVVRGSGWASTRGFWVLMAMLASAPPSFLRRMDMLRFTSLVALACILGIVLLVILFATPALDACEGAAITPHSPSSTGGSECGGEVDILPTQGAVSFLNKISTFVFAYTCHQNIFSLTNELYEPTTARVNVTIVASIGSAMVLYLIVSLCGYLTYGNDVGSDILEEYPTTPIVSVARVAISLVVVFSYPLQLHPARASIKSIVNFCAEHCCGAAPPPEPSHKSGFDERSAHPEVLCRFGPTFGGKMAPDDSMHYLITGLFLPLSFLIAFTVTDLGIILGVVGAIGSTTISYILPGFCFWRLRPDGASTLKVTLAFILFVVGCIIMPLALTMVFIS